MNMWSVLCLCFSLAPLLICDARPNPHTDERRPAVYLELFPGEPQESERINLHHSLKEAGDAATKAVKDIHGYVRQQLTSMAKKTTDIISTPLIKLLGPVQYLRDKLDSLASGPPAPTVPEDISVWCPECAEMNRTGNIRPATPPGVDYYLTLDLTTSVQESSSPSSSHALPEEHRYDVTEPVDLSGLEIISPADWEKLNNSKSKSTESLDSTSSSEEEESGIDIRFGKDVETKEQS